MSVFVRSINSDVNAKCENCGSTDLTRLVSQVSIPKFGGGGPDGAFDMNDADMAAMMQQMGGMGGMGGMGMPGMGMPGMGGMEFGDDDDF